MKQKSLFQHLAAFNLPLKRLLQVYPPFVFIGVKICEFSPDHRFLRLRVPLRWYGKNLHGTMFGGFICAVSDPIAALMAGHVLTNVEVWTKKHSVEFLRPGRSDLYLDVRITDDDVARISSELKRKGKCIHTFIHFFTDVGGMQIARVENSVFFRKKDRPHKSAHANTRP